MIRHVINWKLAAEDTATKAEHASTIARELQGLVSLIPEIRALSVATNAVSIETNWDVCLIADYDDEAALRTYIDHPEHQRVVPIIRALVSERAAVDFLV